MIELKRYCEWTEEEKAVFAWQVKLGLQPQWLSSSWVDDFAYDPDRYPLLRYRIKPDALDQAQ